MITTPELNTYGPYARASLLADYVELLALKGQQVKLAILADFLADNGWNLALIQSPEDDCLDGDWKPLSEQLDDAHEVASIVFRQIDERRRVLSNRYPFELTENALSLDTRVDVEASAYAAVLALTIAHAFNVTCNHRPHEMFERIVTKVLLTRGFLSAGLAVHRRNGRSFEEALRIACEQVRLKAAPDAAPRHKLAHDEGVDILCHIDWEEDLRPGTWGFIGQVTVGRSDSWEKKAKEPAPEQWKCFTGTWLLPSPFLAVPHHVERQMMELLTSKSSAVVLDRLRLVRYRDRIEADEREIIQTVIGQDVERLVG